MAVISAIAGVVAVVVGLNGSLRWDTPAGPSVVVAALALFLVSLGVPMWRRSHVAASRGGVR